MKLEETIYEYPSTDSIREIITKDFDKSNFFLGYDKENPMKWEEIDKHIVDMLKKFSNANDFYTIFSCEGHKQGDAPYIVFKFNEKGYDLFWSKIVPELNYNRILPCQYDTINELQNSSSNYKKLYFDISVTHNQYHRSISIHCNSTSREDWIEHKEHFWNIIDTSFTKHFGL